MLGLVAVVLLVGVWEGYKAVDGRVLGVDLPLKADDRAMPHVSTMLERFGDPESRGSDRTVGATVAASAWYTFQVALGGLAVGCLVGAGLAAVMQRFGVAERAVLPLVIISQTVPIVAFAPLVSAWGGKLRIGSGEYWVRYTRRGLSVRLNPLRWKQVLEKTAMEPAGQMTGSPGSSPW